MGYVVQRRPATGNVEDWIYNELLRISAALDVPTQQIVYLVESHREPERPRDGMVVFADGVDWNPGAGRGVYVYNSSAWVKL